MEKSSTTMQAIPEVTPPPYPSSQKVWRKREVVTLVYASAVTVILVVLLVGGSLYIHEKRTKISQMYELQYTEKSGSKKEVIDVDGDRGISTIFQEDVASGNISLAVIDYKNGVGGFYLPKYGACFLTTNLRDKITEDIAKSIIFSAGESSEITATVDGHILTLASHSTLLTHDAFPAKLHNICRSRPLYGLHIANHANEQEDNNREKRDVPKTKVIIIIIIIRE